MKGVSASRYVDASLTVACSTLTLPNSLLTNLMLPDGAERQPADWTVFFLNQTPFNTIQPILALDNDDDGYAEEEGSRMLYVINLVRTKLDKTARRCVPSPHPQLLS